MARYKLVFEACVTDLKSAEAAIRVKRQMYSNSRIFVSRAVMDKVAKELRQSGRGYSSVWYSMGFDVDGCGASIGLSTSVDLTNYYKG